MEISERHVEWAVVDRLSKLLTKPDDRFNVTDTYASFVGILCWVMQRVRAKDDTPATKTAQKLWDDLSQKTVEDWGIVTREDIPTEMPSLSTAVITDVEPFSWKSRPLNKFLVDLRNATAHGDARTIAPFNLRVKGRAEVKLAGFTFHCTEKARDNSVIWRGSITLREADMQSIGGRLARSYCESLGGDEFARDADCGVIEIPEAAARKA